MNMILKNEYLEAISEADLVIERGLDTFLCYRARGVPFDGEAEDADIWKIKFFHSIETQYGKNTMLLYPDGRADYCFAPNKIDQYTFSYGM